jgi:2-iminobutanoate/2-iminopropanoate deaminase
MLKVVKGGDMETIQTDAAPAAIGPYSQAMTTDGFVFCSGQIPLDPKTMQLVDGGIEEQTRQVFRNIQAVLEAAGLTLNHVIKTTVFLQDISEFATMNAVYAACFGEHAPARSAVEVAKLPLGAKVEIECIAVR